MSKNIAVIAACCDPERIADIGEDYMNIHLGLNPAHVEEARFVLDDKRWNSDSEWIHVRRYCAARVFVDIVDWADAPIRREVPPRLINLIVKLEMELKIPPRLAGYLGRHRTNKEEERQKAVEDVLKAQSCF